MFKIASFVSRVAGLIVVLTISGFASSQIIVNTGVSTAACNDDGTASITISGGTSPYTIEWIDAFGNIISTNQNPTNLHGGSYSIKVTDANGIIGYGYEYITPPFNVSYSVPVVPDCGQNNGIVVASVSGGSAAYTFIWGTGAINVSSNNIDSLINISGGNYDLTVQDANGCEHTPDSIIYVWSNPSFTIGTTTTPSDCDNGTASVSVSSGTPVNPVTYVWTDYSPNQTFFGANISGLEPGWLGVKATDAIGCEAYSNANVAPGPNYLQTSVTTTTAVCPNNNGAIDLTIIGGGTPPFSYSWNTGATTQDISGLSSGTYTVTISDAGGCVITRNKYVPGSSPVIANASVSQTPTCWNSDGSVMVNASGGTAPYTYSWNAGPATQSYTGIPMGYYGVYVTDANGCQDYDYVHLDQPSNCWAYIEGTVYNDVNGNCVVDAGDDPRVGQIITLAGYGAYANSQQTGSYSAKVVPGTYDVFHAPQSGYTLNCPTAPYTVAAAAGVTYPGNDFYDQPDSIYSDMSVWIVSGAARPGFNQNTYVYIKNNGTFAQSGSVEVQLDPLFSFNNSNPTFNAYNSTTNTVTLNYNGLWPNQSKTYTLYSSVPASAVISTPVSSSALINPILNDAFPANNYDTSNFLITGSYDPNIKEVNPAGVGPEGYITTDDDLLEYTVHFQNTGTDTAFTVVIRDTLDNNVYIPSFKVNGHSHDMHYTINGRALEFVFDDILLVDSTTNEPLSHGMVSYSIEQVTGLVPGDEIHNTASIYFDYNLPIVTNTTVNTISNSIGVEDLSVSDVNMTIFPNPFNDQITLNYELPENANVQIQITDATGKLIQSIVNGSQQRGNYTKTINFVSGLEHGLYFVHLSVNGQTSVKKIIH